MYINIFNVCMCVSEVCLNYEIRAFENITLLSYYFLLRQVQPMEMNNTLLCSICGVESCHTLEAQNFYY